MPHDPAYLLAEKKIEEARRKGALEINLSDIGLTEIPESLGKRKKYEFYILRKTISLGCQIFLETLIN